MAWIPGETGMKALPRLHTMELKNAHIAVVPTTALAAIEGKCPSCYRIVRRPLDSFKELSYLCACGTIVTAPRDLDVLLAAAIKTAERRRQRL
jgi:hypothetical protein